MNRLAILACLLATATVIRAEGNLVEDYMKYLMKYMEQCAEEMKISGDELRNIQIIPTGPDNNKLGCLRSCVMKRMDALVDNKVSLAPINTMIETVHAGKPDEIEKVKKVASDCAADVEGETDECNIALRYSDCYIGKLMGAF